MGWALGGKPGVHSCLSYMQHNPCCRIPECSVHLKPCKNLAKEAEVLDLLEGGLVTDGEGI